MFESDKKSPLDRVKKSLYSRTIPERESPRHDIRGSRAEAPVSWSDDERIIGSEPEEVPFSVAHRRIYKAAFVVSGIFLLLALALAAYNFFGGGNFVSVDNVDILIEGPSSVAGGEPLELSVSVINKNASPIELVDLIVEYPEGAKDPADPTKDLSRLRLSLGDIGSQSVAQRTLSSLLFGEEGAIRDIKFTAEYRTAGSNAIFFKEKTYRTTVSSSPILVSIEAPGRALSGVPAVAKITISSNAIVPIRDLLLSVDYPFGVSFVSANPVPSYGNSVWRVGDLAPGAKRTVSITLSPSGQDGEERAIRVNVGIQSQSNEREIATTIISGSHTLALERPFLGVDLALEGERQDLATIAGDSVRAELIWSNNSADRITDVRIVAKLSGSALDKNSIRVDDGGYYDSLNNMIIWEAGRVDDLESIAPGTEGRVGFSLTPVASSAANQSISVKVSASGDRTGSSGVPEVIESAVERQVRLISNLALSARAIRSGDAIVNSGPIPPRVDQVSTYTIVWTATNTTNTVTGARVTASLPPQVSWTGTVNPLDANISYNDTGGTIIWSVGEMARNTSKQVSFQVSLRPSTTQIGTSPELVSAASITGQDAFTGVILKNSSPSVTTRTTSDLSYKQGDEAVQR